MYNVQILELILLAQPHLEAFLPCEVTELSIAGRL